MKIIELSDVIREQISKKIEELSMALMKHANRRFCLAGIAQCDWRGIEEDGIIYVIIPGPDFKRLMLEQGYINAIDKNRDLFGTGDILDVVTALQVSEKVCFPGLSKLCEYVCYLCDENMAYIFEVKNEILTDRVLRLDLYRGFKDREFIGGIFHTFKHFTIKGYETLSCVKNKPFKMECMEDIILAVVNNFFADNFKEEADDKGKGNYYIAESTLQDNHTIKGVYYKENCEEGTVYFLSSLHIDRKKNDK